MADITYKQGAALSVGYSAAGKIFSLVSSLMLAFLFGASARMDIYFYIILASALLNGWLQAISSTVIIPQFIHLKQKNNMDAVNFANFFLYIFVAIALLIISLFYFWPLGSLSAISAFPIWELAANQNLALFGALYFTSYLIMSFLIYLAESYKLFSIYKLSLLNTVLPLALLIITRRLEMMLIGYIAAYLIQALFCVVLLRLKAGWFFSFKIPAFEKKFIQNFWYYQPNNLIWTALAYAPLFLISSAYAGIVSTVNYSRMVADSPVDVLVSKLSNIARVKFTTQAAAKEATMLAHTFLRADKIMLFLLMPICVFTAVFALDIVKLLFMRGSFNLQTAQSTAYFLQFFILAVPLISLATNFTALSSALRIVRETVLRYSLLAICFIGFYVLAIKYIGPQAYPCVFLALYMAIALMNAFTAKKYIPFINYGSHMGYGAKLFLISVLCALGAKYVFSWYDGSVLIKVFICGLFFCSIYFVVLSLSGFVKDIIACSGIKHMQQSSKKN